MLLDACNQTTQFQIIKTRFLVDNIDIIVIRIIMINFIIPIVNLLVKTSIVSTVIIIIIVASIKLI